MSSSLFGSCTDALRTNLERSSLRWINGDFSAGCWIDRPVARLACTVAGPEKRDLNSENDRFRLAIAALAGPERLSGAVRDLYAGCFAPSDLCLAGTPDALEAFSAHPGVASEPLLIPLLNVEPISLALEFPIVATSNRPMTAIKHGAASTGPDVASGSCWLPNNARDTLVGRMAKGDLLLMAGPLATDRLAQATRVLLRHSDQPVQSHILVAPGWKSHLGPPR